MAKKKDEGELLAIKGRKRLYTKPLKPGLEQAKRRKREEKEAGEPKH